jgi:hypothetical protein
METTTSFDLNRAIQQWRETLAQSPAFRSENLHELQGHLRDSVAGLEARGLSAEEAFMIATKRIGRVDSLEAEYGKVNGGIVWLDRTLWMLIGLQVWGFVSGLLFAISSGAVSLGLVGGKFDFAAHGRTLPIVLFAVVRLLALAGSLALCWWLIVGKGQRLGSRIERLLAGRVALVVICVALCLVSLLGSSFGYSSTMLLLKFADKGTFGEVMISQAYPNLFGGAIQVGALIVLTLTLARKRLRMSRA